MVLFIGTFTGFGNTITDLAKDSEKVIIVSADDVITVDLVIFNMVEQYAFVERVSLPDRELFVEHSPLSDLCVMNSYSTDIPILNSRDRANSNSYRHQKNFRYVIVA
tara:strand:- start:274 stop:594 length:321 start_codon:yes stop_codon:yes gene_type:complete